MLQQRADDVSALLLAAGKGLDVVGRLPLDPAFAALCDAGKIEDYEEDYLDSLTYKISALLESEQ